MIITKKIIQIKNHMCQHFSLDSQGNIINTRKLIFFVFFIFFLSCSSKRIKKENFRTSSITLSEIRFKDDSFKNLIFKSVEDFRQKKSHSKNSVLIFEISNRDSIPTIFLTNKFFFKTEIEEELDFNYSYEAGLNYKGILIISQKNEYNLPNRFYEITNEKKNFNYIVGNNLDFCKEEIEFKNNRYIKVTSDCTFDLYVD